MEERRGFYVFEVGNEEAEEHALGVLAEYGLSAIRVEEREYAMDRIYITFEYHSPLPLGFRDAVNNKGVVI